MPSADAASALTEPISALRHGHCPPTPPPVELTLFFLCLQWCYQLSDRTARSSSSDLVCSPPPPLFRPSSRPPSLPHVSVLADTPFCFSRYFEVCASPPPSPRLSRPSLLQCFLYALSPPFVHLAGCSAPPSLASPSPFLFVLLSVVRLPSPASSYHELSLIFVCVCVLCELRKNKKGRSEEVLYTLSLLEDSRCGTTATTAPPPLPPTFRASHPSSSAFKRVRRRCSRRCVCVRVALPPPLFSLVDTTGSAARHRRALPSPPFPGVLSPAHSRCLALLLLSGAHIDGSQALPTDRARLLFLRLPDAWGGVAEVTVGGAVQDAIQSG